MSAYKSGGKWRYRRKGVALPDGREVDVSGTPAVNTRAAAEQAEVNRVALEVDRVRFPERYLAKVEASPGPALTFGEFWRSRYFPTLTNTHGTVGVKADHFRLHLEPAIGRLLLSAIDRRGLDVLTSGLVAPTKDRKGLGAKMARDVLGTLRHALTKAVEWGDLVSVPKWPSIRVSDPEWDFLTVAESKSLLQAARDPRDRLLLWFALATGARQGEQMALEWGDISFTPGAESVRFRRAIYDGVLGPTKGKHHRSVPLPPALADALQAARLEAGARALVFVDEEGRQQRGHQLLRCVKRTLKAAQLRQVRRPWHALRHSFASHLVQAGVPLNVVQNRLGHTTIAMTMKYAHLTPEQNRLFVDLGFEAPGQRRAKTSGAEGVETENRPSLN